MSKSDIEDRLKSLIEESGGKKSERCTSLPCKIVSVLGFVLLAASCSLAFFAWFRWEANLSNYSVIERNLTKHKENLTRALGEVEKQRNALKECNVKLKKVKEQIKNLVIKIDDTKNKTADTEKRMVDVNKQLTTNKGERDQLKLANDELKKKYNKSSESLLVLQKTMQEVSASLASTRNGKITWQVISGIELFCMTISAAIDIYLHSRASQLQVDAQRASQYALDYHKAAAAFENYAFLSRVFNKPVKRTLCFHNGEKEDLQMCAGVKPSIVTVSTFSGYRFAVYLEAPWTTVQGNYGDPNSFVVSVNRNAVAHIRPNSSNNALTVRSESLMEFGSGGIAISLDGKNGTARASAYDVPKPYTADNFLSGDSVHFDVADIKIERIEL